MPSKKINGLIRLFRPELPLAAGICVTTGQVLAAGKLPPLLIGILGFVCGFALSSADLILNDYFDYEVDLVNHPDRPLPSGAVTRSDVIGLTAVTTLVILLSFLPILMGWLGTSYLVMILITDVVLVYFSIRLLKSQTPATGRQAMRGAYLGATLGILAFLIW
jgi:geranylgeranylglycerol-phosphate geranylgeranyltransferase